MRLCPSVSAPNDSGCALQFELLLNTTSLGGAAKDKLSSTYERAKPLPHNRRRSRRDKHSDVRTPQVWRHAAGSERVLHFDLQTHQWLLGDVDKSVHWVIEGGDQCDNQ